LIVRKIIEIVAIRCHILRLKFTKFDFGWGSRSRWGSSQLPRPLLDLRKLRGPTSKRTEGMGGKGREEKGEGKKKKKGGRGGREKEGRGDRLRHGFGGDGRPC